MSEITMLSRMTYRWVLTFDRCRKVTAIGDTEIEAGYLLRLTVQDARLDTDTVYEGEQGPGMSALVARAYADYCAEYGA